jgi:hypothetical protein
MQPNFFNDPKKNKQYLDPWGSRAVNSFVADYIKYKNPAPKAPVKQKGKGGFLTSLISEGGGAGGAAGGAALGTLLLPGVGTILGAGLGGLIGGTAGRGVENKIRDNQNFLGAGGSAKSAIGEGILAGALSSAGAGFQAFKGAKAAKGLTGALGGTDDAAKAASKSMKNAPRVGMFERKGVDVTSKAGGYYARDNAPGIGKITTDKVKYYDDLLRKSKIGANDAGDLARSVRTRINALNTALDDSLTKGNRPLSRAELDAFAKDIMKTMNKGGVTKESKKYVADQLRTMKSTVKDVKGLHRFRGEVDDAINWNANPDSATAQMQAGAKHLRSGIRDKLNNSVPGLKQTNNLYHDFTDIEKLALKANSRVAANATSAGNGLTGRILTSSPVNTVRAKGGQMMAAGGKYTAGTGGFGTQVTNNAIRQSPANLTEALMTSTGATAPPEELAPADPMAEFGANLSAGPETGGFGGEVPQTAPPMGLEDALRQAAGILGPDQTPSTYLQYAKEIMEQGESSGGTAAQKQSASKAQGAGRIIDELEAVFNSSGGARGPIAGRMEQLGAAAGGGNQALKSYQDMRSAYTAQISRALGEVGVLTDKDREVIQRAIPSVNDSQEAAGIKIQTLRNILNQLASRGGGSDANDLYSAIAQMQQTQQQGTY